MIYKKDVLPICQQIASEHEGWSYTNSRFKYDALKHTIISIEPLWSFNLSAQPEVWIKNKKVSKLAKECIDPKYLYISTRPILEDGAVYESQVYTEFVYDLENAERYIREFFRKGLLVINEYYNYSDEEDFLRNMPMDLRGSFGIGYILSKVVLYDFKEAKKLLNKKIKADSPDYNPNLDVLKEYIPIWEERYQTTGSLFLKKSKTLKK